MRSFWVYSVSGSWGTLKWKEIRGICMSETQEIVLSCQGHSMHSHQQTETAQVDEFSDYRRERNGEELWRRESKWTWQMAHSVWANEKCNSIFLYPLEKSWHILKWDLCRYQVKEYTPEALPLRDAKHLSKVIKRTERAAWRFEEHEDVGTGVCQKDWVCERGLLRSPRWVPLTSFSFQSLLGLQALNPPNSFLILTRFSKEASLWTASISHRDLTVDSVIPVGCMWIYAFSY